MPIITNKNINATNSNVDILAKRLAELIIYYGNEDNAAYLRRLNNASKLLRKIAPETLKQHGQF